MGDLNPAQPRKGLFTVSDPHEADDHAERMTALEDKIAALKGGEERRPHQDEHYTQAQMAWRMVLELVTGLGIGFGIGYRLDQLFGSTPWLMIIFIFVGLAAGVKTMMRSAEEIQNDRLAAMADKTEED